MPVLLSQPMTDYGIIANQWECLCEPERQLAHIIAQNGALLLGQVVDKDTADAMFEAERGTSWEIYRDFWLANWNIF